MLEVRNTLGGIGYISKQGSTNEWQQQPKDIGFRRSFSLQLMDTLE